MFVYVNKEKELKSGKMDGKFYMYVSYTIAHYTCCTIKDLKFWGQKFISLVLRVVVLSVYGHVRALSFKATNLLRTKKYDMKILII